MLFVDLTGKYKVAIIGDDTQTKHNFWGLDWAGYTAFLYDIYGSDNLEIDVVRFTTAEEFVAGWNSLDDEYDELDVFAHGYSSKPALWFQTKNEALTTTPSNGLSFSSLKHINVRSSVQLNVCYAAKEHNNVSIGKVFANLTSHSVSASTEQVCTFFSPWGLELSLGWTTVYPYIEKPKSKRQSSMLVQ